MKEGFLKTWRQGFKRKKTFEKIEQEKIPLMPISYGESLLGVIPGITISTMGSFVGLPDEMQENIIADITEKRKGGMKTSDLLVRVEDLIKRSQKFESLDPTQISSDRTYVPKISTEDMEVNNFVTRNTTILMEQGEKRRTDPKKDEYKN